MTCILSDSKKPHLKRSKPVSQARDNKIYYQVAGEKINRLVLDIQKLWIRFFKNDWTIMGAVRIQLKNQPFHLIYLVVPVKAMKRKDKLGFP